MSLRQYQPVTGPVYRGSVAAGLSWLPQGQPRVPDQRSASSNHVIPFVTAIAVAASMAWVPMGAARAFEAPQPRQSVLAFDSLPRVPFVQPTGIPRVWPSRVSDAWTVVAPFQPAPAFDPALLPVVTVNRFTPLERRVPSEVVEPILMDVAAGADVILGDIVRAIRRIDTWQVTAPVLVPTTPFDPALFPVVTVNRFVPLEYRVASAFVEPILTDVAIGVDATSGTIIRPVRAVASWQLVEPVLVPTTAFDPALFTRTVVIQTLQRERRVQSESVEPFTQALYKPEGLQWIPTGRDIPRAQARPIQTWSLLSPLPIATPFDPAKFPWAPVTLYKLLERRWPGGMVEPFVQALYKPEGLQWTPRGQSYGVRTAPRAVQTWSLLSPLPIPNVSAGCPKPVFTYEVAQAVSFASEVAQATSFASEVPTNVVFVDTCGDTGLFGLYDGQYLHNGVITYGAVASTGECVTPIFTGETPAATTFTDACENPL